MTWRSGLLALWAGVCGTLLPACLSTPTQHTVALPPDPQPAADAPARPAATAAASSYHVLPAPPPPAERSEEEDAAETDRSGARPTAAGLVPPAAPPADPAVELPAAVVVTKVAESGHEPPAKENKDPALVTALREFLDKRPADAIGQLKDYDRLSQELLLGLLPLTARAGEGNLEKASPEQLAILLDQVDSLEAPLRVRAPLEIDKICFCRRIEAFGVYDQLPDEPAFQPGDWALVYVELRNFTCERRDGAAGLVSYGTRLVSAAEIRDYAGKKVWPSGPDQLVFRRKGPEESRTPWHDYFDNCSLRVPALAPGRYTLWIEIQDVPTKRTVKRSLDFRVSSSVPDRGS